MAKSIDEAYNLLEEMATNNYQWPTEQAIHRKIAGIHDVDAFLALSAQIIMQVISVQAQKRQCNLWVIDNRIIPTPTLTTQGGGIILNQSSPSTLRPNAPLVFHQQAGTPISEKKPTMEDLLRQYMTQNDNIIQSQIALIQSQAASIQNLETQVGQLTNLLDNRPQGTLPSDTKVNPRRDSKKQVMAITLRSEKEVEHSVKQANSQDELVENKTVIETVDKQSQKKEAKRKLKDFETITLIEEYSAIIHNKLPPKLRDQGSFSIPYSIVNFNFSKALCDLSVGVSIMPLSVPRRIGLKGIQHTIVTLQLVDRTIRHPCGVIKNVLLKLGKLFILIYFIVLETEEDEEVLTILRHPFLATTGALIDVREGRITFRVRDEVVEFTIFNTTMSPSTTTHCYRVDLADKDEGNPTPPSTSKQASTHELEPLPLHLNMKQCYDVQNLPPFSDLDFEVG
ncbi:PREDICTED: uncharacterized protein LOC108661554 [Theobroma cacao]|uniref:Uncharacterized protein LOC108661554 n=1 Tax=Theobroma cacao TaxID=3641 RepID=A0AB32W8U4_THECC|nr:PREDICTED: uncharacterized protein LOC108661554 [Theobroma cacao]